MKKLTLDKVFLGTRLILIPIAITFLGNILNAILNFKLMGILLVLTFMFLLGTSILDLIKRTKRTRTALDYNLTYILYLIYLMIISYRINEAAIDPKYYQYISDKYVYTNFSILSVIALGLGITTLLLIYNKKVVKTEIIKINKKSN